MTDVAKPLPPEAEQWIIVGADGTNMPSDVLHNVMMLFYVNFIVQSDRWVKATLTLHKNVFPVEEMNRKIVDQFDREFEEIVTKSDPYFEGLKYILTPQVTNDYRLTSVFMSKGGHYDLFSVRSPLKEVTDAVPAITTS